MKILLLILFLTSTFLSAQKKKETDEEKSKKTYSEIIDDAFKSDNGLFKFHQKDQIF